MWRTVDVMILLVVFLSLTLTGMAKEPRQPSLMTHFINDFHNVSIPGNISDLTVQYEANCPKNHLCTRTYPPGWDFQVSCCEKCGCHKGCYEDGTCCPDVLPLFEHPLVHSCVPFRLQDYSAGNWTLSKSAFLAVSKCPQNFSDQKVKDLCEDHHPFPRSRQETTLHVPTVANKTLFKNRYCAKCHGNQNSVDLEAQLVCSQQERPHVQSFTDLLTQVSQGLCSLAFLLPFGVSTKLCDWGTITYCNQTGKMAAIDSNIAAMCNSFTSVFEDAFKNVFCYMCNEPDIEQSSCNVTRKHDMEPYVVFAFSAILDLSELSSMADPPTKQTTEVKDDKCTGADEFYDAFQGKCVTPFCAEGAVYNNNTCVSLYSSESTTSFDLFLVISEAEISASENVSMWNEITENLTEIIAAIGIQSDICFINTIWDTKSSFYCHIRFGVSQENNVEFMKKALTIADFSQNQQNGSSYVHFFITRQVELIDNLASGYKHVKYGPMDVIYRKTFFNFGTACAYAIRLQIIEPIAICPRVELDLKLFDVYNSSTVCISAIDYCLTNDLFTNTSYSIQLCAEVYREKVEFKTLSTSQNRDICPPMPLNSPKVVFTLIVYTVSTLCLVATILVYSILPSLLTLPGKNIICLCLSLFIGLTLFTFGAGQSQMGAWCSVLGSLTHYFLISAICWTNVCSLHMFHLFAVNTTSVVRRQHAFLKNFLYCLFAPMFFVISNVVISYFIWGSHGYGSNCDCFISPVVMKLSTLIAPIFLLVLINLILYLITVVQLHRSQAAAPRKEQKRSKTNEFAIYIKLSTLTGITWIWGLFYALFQVVALDYIFVTFNLGQGILIFFCFVTRKNVWKALCQKRKSLNSRLHRSLRSTMSSSI